MFIEMCVWYCALGLFSYYWPLLLYYRQAGEMLACVTSCVKTLVLKRRGHALEWKGWIMIQRQAAIILCNIVENVLSDV